MNDKKKNNVEKEKKKVKKEKSMQLRGEGRIDIEKRKIKLCLLAFLRRFFFIQLAVGFIFLILFSIFFLLNTTFLAGILTTSLSVPAVIVILVGDILLSLYSFYVWKNTYYYLREDSSVVYRRVLFFRVKEVFYTLNRNADFKLREGPLDTLFNCGTIKIVGPTIEKVIWMHSIRNPQEVLDILKTNASTEETDTLIMAEG